MQCPSCGGDCGYTKKKGCQYRGNQPTWVCPMPSEIADAARVVAWARDPNRKPANTAFTAGPERQAAYWIEWTEQQIGEHVPSA